MKKDRKQTVLHIEPKKVQIHAGYDDIVQTKLTARVWYHDCNAKKKCLWGKGHEQQVLWGEYSVIITDRDDGQTYKNKKM